MSIDAEMCDECGDIFIVGESCDCGKHTKPDDGKMQAILDQWRGEAIRLREERAKQNERADPTSDDSP